jgi:hypothetical protein
MKKKKGIILKVFLMIIGAIIASQLFIPVYNNMIVDSIKSSEQTLKAAYGSLPYHKIEDSIIIKTLEDYEKLTEESNEDPDVSDLFREGKNIIIVPIWDESCNPNDRTFSMKQNNGVLNIIVTEFIDYAVSGVCSGDPIYIIPISKDIADNTNDIKVEYKYINYMRNIIEIIQDAYEEPSWDKPILYLYPQREMIVNVKIVNSNNIITSYPKYNDEWKVLAKPNGDLFDINNNKYYYGLYWDEGYSSKYNFKEGFYVTKDNAIEFLENKLQTIGLNGKERNEFIMYWLPILEKNGKNLVSFEFTDDRNKTSPLIIEPAPDSILRFGIHIKKVQNKVNIKEQMLPTFERKGFVAVEWGGTVH